MLQLKRMEQRMEQLEKVVFSIKHRCYVQHSDTEDDIRDLPDELGEGA